MFDLTENDLNEEINIKDANHRKRIMKDLKFLKKIYTKNPDESEYIRNKLLKFYEKNQLFTKKDDIENKKDKMSLITPVVHVNGSLASEMTAKRELKDINDRQDSLDVSQERKLSSSSSSSSSSNDEQSEATEKAVPVRRNQNANRRGDDDDESVAEHALHMSEYRSKEVIEF